MNSSDISDIIDNKRCSLKGEINSILKATEEAKFAVGYLFLSGFDEIATKVSHLKELKLIIGASSNTQTLEEIAEGMSRREELEEAAERLKYQKPTEKRAIANTLQTTIGRSIGGLEQSEADRKSVV